MATRDYWLKWKTCSSRKYFWLSWSLHWISFDFFFKSFSCQYERLNGVLLNVLGHAMNILLIRIALRVCHAWMNHYVISKKSLYKHRNEFLHQVNIYGKLNIHLPVLCIIFFCTTILFTLVELKSGTSSVCMEAIKR